MLISVILYGEHFDLPISGRVVKKALIKILKERYHTTKTKALELIRKLNQVELEKVFYKELKHELRPVIKSEMNWWRMYEFDIKRREK